MIGKCTHCQAENAELYGVQRICETCRRSVEGRAMDMLYELRMVARYGQVSQDLPAALEARINQLLEGLPQ